MSGRVFIDKHTFHFSDNDIKNYLIKYNFKIIDKIFDKENAIFLIKKTSFIKKNIKNNYKSHKILIKNYAKNMSFNVAKLKKFKKNWPI